MSAPTRTVWIRPSAARRCTTLVLLIALSLLAGCSDEPASPRDPAPSAAPSPVAGLRDIGHGVLLDRAVADGAKVRVEPDVTALYPEYEQLSPVYEVTLIEQPDAGARLALPALRAFEPQTELPLVFVDTPTGPWTPLPTQAVPGRNLVAATCHVHGAPGAPAAPTSGPEALFPALIAADIR